LDQPVPVAARLDLAALREQVAADALHPMLRALARVPSRPAQRLGASAALAQRLAGLDDGEQQRLLTDLVRGAAAAVLNLKGPEAINASRAFSDAGFDSLMAIELRNRLNKLTGLQLPTTIVFDHPNSSALAAALASELLGGAAPGQA